MSGHLYATIPLGILTYMKNNIKTKIKTLKSVTPIIVEWMDDGYDDNDPILVCQNPIVMKMIYNPNGHYVKIKQWIELCDDDMYMMRCIYDDDDADYT